MGTRLCGICFKSLWFFAGCRCALNRNSLIFSVIFTFSSLQPILKRNFQMCSVQSFVLIIVNQFMVIKFTLIGYSRTRYVFTKLPNNSFFEYIFEIRQYYYILLCTKCSTFKSKTYDMQFFMI